MAEIPTVTAAQMAQIDQIMMDHLGVDVLQLMEAAGLAVTEAIRIRLGGDISGRRVVLLAGSGGNGGDALVAARYLRARGGEPEVILTKRATDLHGVTAHQHRLAVAFGVPVSDMPGADLPREPVFGLIVDGMLGFSGKGNPRGAIVDLIRFANEHPAPVLAIDLPSGLDATSGEAGDPCILADATITLALPKQGFVHPDAHHWCGEITVADIGVPASVVGQVGVTVSSTLFAQASALPWSPGV